MNPSKKLLLLNLKNVCRLCGSKSDLVSVFDKKFNDHRPMHNIVKLTTTVEILEEDKISHKICAKCIASAIKFFQFRDQCIIQNEMLKKQYAELIKDEKQPTKSEDSPAPVTSNKTETIKSEDSRKSVTSNTTMKPIKSEDLPKSQITPKPKQFRVHSSVKKLFKNYSQIRLPTTVLGLNISPHAVMELNSVENYFKLRKLDMNKYIQISLKKPRSVAFKSTSKLANNPKITSKLKSNSFKNLELVTRTSNDSKPAEELIPKRGKKRQRSSSGSTSSNSNNTSQKKKIETSSSSNSKKILPLETDPSSSDISTASSNLQKTLPLNIDQSSSSISSISSNSKISLSLEINPSPSSSPVPSTFSDDMSDVCDISGKSRDLHVCNICSSVHYRARYLTMHQIKHLRCQFCKLKFKTLEIKTRHVKSQCKIQKVMNGMINLPEINLSRVELDLEIRKKYCDVFQIFPPIPGLEQNVIDLLDAENTEIISDDDASKKSTTNLLKPKIEIKDGILNNLLLENSNSNDIKILKSLLSSYNKVHKKVNDSTQTKLPTNELIKINDGELFAEMKYLKQHLSYYKIPIDIKHSLIPNTCYKYNSGKTIEKEIKYWNQLSSQDIKSDPGYGDYSSIEFINNPLTAPIKEENLLIEEIYNESIPILNTHEVINESDNVLIKGDNVELVDMELEENFEEHTSPNLTLIQSNEKILLTQYLNENGPGQNLEDIEMISDKQNLTASENESSQNLEKSMINNQNNLIQITSDNNNIESGFKGIINDRDASLIDNENESLRNLKETIKNNQNNLIEVNDRESKTSDNNKSCCKEITVKLSDNKNEDLKECRIPNIQDNVKKNLTENRVSNLSVNKDILSDFFVNGNDLDNAHKPKENSLHNGIKNDVQTLQYQNDKNISNKEIELNFANENDDFSVVYNQEDDPFVETSGSICTRAEKENNTLYDKNKDVSISSANSSTSNLDYVENQSPNDTTTVQFINCNKIKLNLLKDLKNSKTIKVINDKNSSTNALLNLGEKYSISPPSTDDLPILRIKTIHELNK